jgi:hypothetical protein
MDCDAVVNVYNERCYIRVGEEFNLLQYEGYCEQHAARARAGVDLSRKGIMRAVMLKGMELGIQTDLSPFLVMDIPNQWQAYKFHLLHIISLKCQDPKMLSFVIGLLKKLYRSLGLDIDVPSSSAVGVAQITVEPPDYMAFSPPRCNPKQALLARQWRSLSELFNVGQTVIPGAALGVTTKVRVACGTILPYCAVAVLKRSTSETDSYLMDSSYDLLQTEAGQVVAHHPEVVMNGDPSLPAFNSFIDGDWLMASRVNEAPASAGWKGINCEIVANPAVTRQDIFRSLEKQTPIVCAYLVITQTLEANQEVLTHYGNSGQSENYNYVHRPHVPAAVDQYVLSIMERVNQTGREQLPVHIVPKMSPKTRTFLIE